ncbi:serine/threonine-protein kinase [Gordonia neofelifaecis]|uniref:non-specific serine/threonine protein kinase n=1 Tax=Gordonia neofelifaecis NRRL B-59395 TaxID=644548 RepID=F1YHR8_9ACTN|nr:serine/threonine-protein kinase [Gordonia neofelifaecis]EGD55906.1 serine/threonine protein kinase-like protein [Gordonia neofelifaecis NRRL B-59395]
MEPGAQFAGYVIERWLGSGGMGEVYLARHPRLPRHDALKVLAPQFTSEPHYRARFEREAELAAGLRHPAIVPVHDRGESEGRLWLSMAYVDGEDLAQRLRATGPLAANQVGFVVAVVADALDRAHSSGLVHRDVKPANILLSHDGDVLLTDFGIARPALPDTALTATGTAVGTLDFASPEQLQGLTVDGRSDQYSLACTAFALLTGVALFADSSAARVITRQLSDPLPSVLARRPDVTAAVDAVLSRATAKDPDLRFASTAEFAGALNRALAEHPAAVAASAQLGPTVVGPNRAPGLPAQAPSSPTSWLTGRRVLMLGAAALVVVLAIGGAIWAVLPDRWKTGEGDYLQELTAAAREMTLPNVNPLLPSLETKPTASKWQYRPPAGQDEGGAGAKVLGAGGDVVLVGRDADVDIVDATTGQTRRTVQIRGDEAAWECGVHASGEWAACQLGTSGPLTTIDLGRGTVTGTTTDSPDSFAIVGDAVVLSSGSGDSYHVEVVDRRAHTLWERDSTADVTIGGPVVGVMPRPSGAFATDQMVAIRVSDGRELAKTDKPARDYETEPQFFPYAGGFLLGDHFYDTDGKQLARLTGTWQPLTVTRGNPLTAPAPALLLMADLDDEIGVIDPATGDLLWSRKLGGAYSAHQTAAGSSVLVTNMKAQEELPRFAWYTLATGEGTSMSKSQLREVLGTDGTRVLISTSDAFVVYDAGGRTPLWRLPIDMTIGVTVQAGGHVYWNAYRVV